MFAGSDAIILSKIEEMHAEVRKLDMALNRFKHQVTHSAETRKFDPISGWIKSIIESYISIVYAGLPGQTGPVNIQRMAIQDLIQFINRENGKQMAAQLGSRIGGAVAGQHLGTLIGNRVAGH